MVKGFCIMICILKRNCQSILLWQQTKELVPWEKVRHPTPRTTSAWSPNAHCPILETAPHLLLPEASVPSTSPGGITQEVPCREGPDTSHHCCVFRPLAQSEAYICWVLVGNKQVIAVILCPVTTGRGTRGTSECEDVVPDRQRLGTHVDTPLGLGTLGTASSTDPCWVSNLKEIESHFSECVYFTWNHLVPNFKFTIKTLKKKCCYQNHARVENGLSRSPLQRQSTSCQGRGLLPTAMR